MERNDNMRSEDYIFNQIVEDDINNYKKHKAQCMYSGCGALNVGSHSISKMISLNQIAESGKLLTPISKRHYPDKKYFIDEVGINDASKFPGFCEDHEKLFNKVDTCGITTEKDIFAQVFRTLNYIYFLENMVNVVRPHIIKRIYKECRVRKDMNDIITSEDHIIQKRLLRWANYTTNIHDILSVCPDNANLDSFLDPFYCIDHKDVDLFIVYKRFPYQIPIAINTKITLRFKNTKKE